MDLVTSVYFNRSIDLTALKWIWISNDIYLCIQTRGVLFEVVCYILVK